MVNKTDRDCYLAMVQGKEGQLRKNKTAMDFLDIYGALRNYCLILDLGVPWRVRVGRLTA